jgi:hypothetical protein
VTAVALAEQISLVDGTGRNDDGKDISFAAEGSLSYTVNL